VACLPAEGTAGQGVPLRSWEFHRPPPDAACGGAVWDGLAVPQRRSRQVERNPQSPCRWTLPRRDEVGGGPSRGPPARVAASWERRQARL